MQDLELNEKKIIIKQLLAVKESSHGMALLVNLISMYSIFHIYIYILGNY